MDSPAAPLPGDADRFQENSGGMPCRLGEEASPPLSTPPHPTICLGPCPGLPAPPYKMVLHWFNEYSMQRPN